MKRHIKWLLMGLVSLGVVLGLWFAWYYAQTLAGRLKETEQALSTLTVKTIELAKQYQEPKPVTVPSPPVPVLPVPGDDAWVRVKTADGWVNLSSGCLVLLVLTLWGLWTLLRYGLMGLLNLPRSVHLFRLKKRLHQVQADMTRLLAWQRLDQGTVTVRNIQIWLEQYPLHVPAWIRLVQLGGADILLKKWSFLPRHFKKQVAMQTVHAQALADREDYEAAAVLLKKQLVSPQGSWALLATYLAWPLADKKGQIEIAQRCMHAYAALCMQEGHASKDKAKALCLLGCLYQQQGLWQEAKQCMEDSLALCPSAATYWYLVRLYEHLGEHGAAQNHCRLGLQWAALDLQQNGQFKQSNR